MKTNLVSFGAAKKLLLISLVGSLAVLSSGTWAADKTKTPGKTAQSTSASTTQASQDTSFNLRKTAAAIREGKIDVGKEYSLDPEKGRFHRVHASVLGMNEEPVLDIKCGGCHSTESYPDDFLYLRKAKLPRMVGDIKVRAVRRQFCIGCHSGGSVSTVYYNPK